MSDIDALWDAISTDGEESVNDDQPSEVQERPHADTPELPTEQPEQPEQPADEATEQPVDGVQEQPTEPEFDPVRAELDLVRSQNAQLQNQLSQLIAFQQQQFQQQQPQQPQWQYSFTEEDWDPYNQGHFSEVISHQVQQAVAPLMDFIGQYQQQQDQQMQQVIQQRGDLANETVAKEFAKLLPGVYENEVNQPYIHQAFLQEYGKVFQQATGQPLPDPLQMNPQQYQNYQQFVLSREDLQKLAAYNTAQALKPKFAPKAGLSSNAAVNATVANEMKVEGVNALQGGNSVSSKVDKALADGDTATALWLSLS